MWTIEHLEGIATNLNYDGYSAVFVAVSESDQHVGLIMIEPMGDNFEHTKRGLSRYCEITHSFDMGEYWAFHVTEQRGL